jgi:putative ABC transport system substrate-binding protein
MKAIALIMTLALSFLVASLVAEAQSAGKVWRVGLLWPGAAPPPPPRMESLRQGLREAGYVEGQNLAIELRYSDKGAERLRELAAELVRLDVHVIAAFGDLAPRAAQQATTATAIVAIADDVLGAGLITSLARPGGNTTGLTILSPELSAKRLELLKTLLPGMSRVVALWDPTTGVSQVTTTQDAARALKVKVQVLEVRGSADLPGLFQAVKREHAEALNVFSSPFLASLYRTIIDLAAEHRLPAIYQWREHAEAGGLVSYGPSLARMWHQTALIIGKILKGAKPADLPVEQPIKFELVINLKTAEALGLTIPPTLLFQADEVIR